MENPKVMLKSENGFIMTKRQMKTVEDDIWWQFAKSPGHGGAVQAAAKVFEDHGYEVVPWDNKQRASDGRAFFEENDEPIEE